MYSSKLLAKCLVAAAMLAPTALFADNPMGTATTPVPGTMQQHGGGDQSEVMRLREENRRLKEENEKLKRQIQEMRSRSGEGKGNMQRPMQKPAGAPGSSTSGSM